MQQGIMVGCDLHDGTMVLRVLGAGKKVLGGVYVTGPNGRQQMFEALKKESRKAGGVPIYLVYEASGLGFTLHDEAVKAGIQCFVLAPSKIEKSVKQRKNKTDAKDAEALLELVKCHVLAGKEMPVIWIPGMELRDDRERVRERLELGAEAARVKARIRSLLKRYELKVPEEAGKGWTKKAKAFLGKESQESTILGPGARAVLESLLRQMEVLEKEAEELEKGFEDLAQKPQYQKPAEKLMELKGVGLLTALVFLTEMGELSRFKNRRQVGSYVGLAPSVDESGESGDRKGHITRHGSARLRKVLCQAVWSSIRHRGKERDFYEKLVEKNPRKKKIAVVAAMRRLAVKMWHVGVEAKRAA
jgi:transposase